MEFFRNFLGGGRGWAVITAHAAADLLGGTTKGEASVRAKDALGNRMPLVQTLAVAP